MAGVDCNRTGTGVKGLHIVKQNIPASTTHSPSRTRLRPFLIALVFAASLAAPGASMAAPDGATTTHAVLAQNVDYIGAGAAAVLDLGFPVLVPGFVPGPFGGSPSIDAGGGYYSLYWMNSGGDPTFLQVTGQVGGGLPAGSPYDLNVELTINASVQGHGAIHDVTPAYDAVWWIAGGVLYKVESRNSGTDSLSLANSLIAFVPPAAPEPTSPPPPPPTAVPPPAAVPEVPASDPGSNTGGSTTAPESPAGATNQDQGETTVPSSQSGQPTSSTDAPATGAVQETDDEIIPMGSDGTGDPTVDSDGTGGAQVAVISGDGTGGANVVTIPRPPGPQTP